MVEIDAGVNKVLMAFGDGSSCVAWLIVCKQSRIIERISEYEYVGYAVIDMPWPVSNRDLVFRSTVDRKASGGAVELTQVAEPLAYPGTKLVRMLSRATYLIEPLDEIDLASRIPFIPTPAGIYRAQWLTRKCMSIPAEMCRR